MYDYRLIRSYRRSLSVSIQNDGTLLVRSPYGLSRDRIELFLASKRKWIDNALKTRQEINANAEHQYLKIGHSAKLEGEDYPLKTAAVKRIEFDGEHLLLPLHFEADSRQMEAAELSRKIREELSVFYRTRARHLLPGLADEIAAAHRLRYNGLSITSARTRWGSCNSRNHLNFSWRLMMADSQCIRYVVCHELAHTLHHNHSAAFWQTLAGLCPECQQARMRLRTLARELQYTGW
ncbi:MAG: M48 family metallopeptidase [Bacteroidales bacterium]|nr:M48 family metallopeptidase [Bacteroidales bacterium]